MTERRTRLPDSSAQLALLQRMVEDISGELALEPLLSRIVANACELIGADERRRPALPAPSAPAEPAVPSGGDKPLE